jgi:transcriptional regulator with XRE-family HTH domain
MIRIKELIKEKGLTSKELAQKMGTSAPALSTIINGNPTIDTLEKVASALDVKLIDLFELPDTQIVSCPHCGGKIRISKE